MTAQKMDQEKTDRFAEQLIGVLNGGALSIMMSIGHRTGLFDKMAELPPSTSQQIADAAGLNERYVREWLGTMVTGRFVEYDAANKTYYLPPEHAALLTRAGRAGLAPTAQFVPAFGVIEDRIIECFYKGGGLPYSAYPRFHEMMAEVSDDAVVSALLEHILPLSPRVVQALEQGTEALDVGCGRGHAVLRMAEAFPNSRFAGYDFSEEAIAAAREEASRKGLANARFEVRDVAALGEKGRYSLITAFDCIHDQARPAAVLAGIAEALRPDGTFLMQDIAGSSHLEKDIDLPVAPLLYSISTMHCMSVSLEQGGEGLGTMWGEGKARQMLADAGFTRVEVQQLPHDIMNFYYLATRA